MRDYSKYAGGDELDIDEFRAVLKREYLVIGTERGFVALRTPFCCPEGAVLALAASSSTMLTEPLDRAELNRGRPPMPRDLL